MKRKLKKKFERGDYDELNFGNPTDVQDEQIESIVEQTPEVVDKLKKRTMTMTEVIDFKTKRMLLNIERNKKKKLKMQKV